PVAEHLGQIELEIAHVVIELSEPSAGCCRVRAKRFFGAPDTDPRALIRREDGARLPDEVLRTSRVPPRDHAVAGKIGQDQFVSIDSALLDAAVERTRG